MSTTRRDFVRMLALLAAGAGAMPEQVAAFTTYYDLNTPPGAGPFVAVDRIFLSGMATESTPLYFSLIAGDAVVLPVCINLFGGMMSFTAAPDQKITGAVRDIRWKIDCPSLAKPLQSVFVGQISYLDYGGVRRYKEIDALEGGLVCRRPS